MSPERLTIRVAAPIAEELVAEGIAQPLSSQERSGALDLVVQASIVAKDVSSVVLAVAAGIRGLRAILDRLQRDERESEVVVTIHSPDGDLTWRVRAGRLDEATKQQIARAVDTLPTARR